MERDSGFIERPARPAFDLLAWRCLALQSLLAFLAARPAFAAADGFAARGASGLAGVIVPLTLCLSLPVLGHQASQLLGNQLRGLAISIGYIKYADKWQRGGNDQSRAAA
jgi:hypothetical protein